MIFYFVVNINSILLAFKQYDGASGQFMWSGETLKQMFTALHTDKGMIFRLVNSLIMYGVSMVVVLPLSLLFSFYIYKKKPASKFFRTMLFLPSVVSPIVLSMLFGYFVDRAIPEIMLKWFGKEVDGLLAGLDTQFSTVIVYNALLGFGVQVLMYANAMSGINDSTIEAARLDGANSMQEFWHISLPSIFPTLTTFVVVGVAGLFTNQLNLLGFFNTSANVETQSIGYYLAAEILNTPDMERDFTERDALFAWESENLSCMKKLENLFIGDSYFEFWNRRRFSQVLFCEKYDTSRNGNIGLGGTTFVDWMRYIPKLSAAPQPKKIFINLGFNDIHTGARAEVVFENYKRVY